MSPDLWNRLMPDGVAAHENPKIGQTNYLYTNIRNGSANDVKATTATFWIARAPPLLIWPSSFEYAGELVVPNLRPGELRQIGPLVWRAPSAAPSTHFAFYALLDTPQNPLQTQSPDTEANARNSNNIALLNRSHVDLPSNETVSFQVRNNDAQANNIDLLLKVPEEFLKVGRVLVGLSPRMYKRWLMVSQNTEGLVPADQRLQMSMPGQRIKTILSNDERQDVVPPSYEVKASQVLLSGLPLRPGDVDVVRLTYSSSERREGQYNVEITEHIGGNAVGSVQYLVRTGRSAKP